MDTLDGVGHGTALGGRYRLEERLHAGPTSSYWRAVDQTLERPVGVRVVTGPAADETLDAARRAALVEDSRLLRVLDVGSEPSDVAGSGRLTYVVSEFVDGRSLASLLHEDGPLEADDVRALVGEAAQGLERARHAGLHHRLLTPRRIVRTPDGKAKVAGLAVDAAAAGAEDTDAVAAARQDAVALVAAVYAGLTGRWPLVHPGTTDEEPLEPAPVVGGRPIPPGDLVSGVPNDLDTLCAVTLGGHDDGPQTPGEVAEQLAPWGLSRATVGANRRADATDTSTQPLVLPAVAAPSSAAPTAGRPAQAAATAATRQAAPGRPPSRFPIRVTGPSALPSPTAMPTTAMPTTAMPTTAMPTAAATPTPSRPSADAGSRDSGRVPFAEAIGTGEYADPPRRGITTQQLVLAAVAVLVVIGLVLAVNSLASIGGGGETAANDVASAPATSEPAASAPPTTSAPPAPAGTPPAIAGITALDPQGDDGENDDEVSDAVDDNPESFWPSSTYRSGDFGGLKDGVGVVVHLAEPSTVSTVTLGLHGEGGAFELRTAPGDGLGGSNVVATGSVTGSSVQVPIDPPAQTQYLIVWFTELPAVDGEFRIELADVQVQ